MVMGLFSVAVADHGPAFIAPIGDQTVEEGDTLVVPINVTPPTGVAIGDVDLQVSGLPDFADFDAVEREITFAPQAGDEGDYGPFTVTASVEAVAPQFRSASANSITVDVGQTLTIAKPNEVEEGDFLIAQVRYRGNEDQGGANLTAPGWQEVEVGSIQGTSQSNHTVLWRIAGTSEPEDYTFTQILDGGRMAGGIGAYMGVDLEDPINTATKTGSDTSILVAPDTDTTHDNTRVLRLWGWRSIDATEVGVPSGVEERWSEQTGHETANDRNQVIAGDHVQAGAGPVGESRADVSGVLNNPNAFTVALNPAIRGGEDTETFTVMVTSEASATEDHFTDDDGHLFEDDINAIASEGITRGCNPPVNDEFCPDDTVTRGQMAAFLVRALGYTDDGGGDRFVDDDHSVFEGDIDRLATAGVTRGCNPPVNDRFCPDEDLTRGQMAAFLVRALGYTDDGGGDRFVDDDDSVFEGDIDRLATAGVTRGCNPPVNDRFCPEENLTRGQMAAFLARALIYNR